TNPGCRQGRPGKPTLLTEAEGHTLAAANARQRGPCAVGDPSHVRNLSAREPGDPRVAHGGWRRGPHQEGRRPYADDERRAEVGRAHCTCEALEQGGAVRCGGGGGKGPGRGEHGRAKRTPDSVPDRRCAQCARPCTTESKTGQKGKVHDALPS